MVEWNILKKILDIGGESAYLDCIDDNEPQLIEGKKGYSPLDILNFVMIIKFVALVMIG